MLETLPLVRMVPEVIRARDGLELVSYLSLPASANPREREREKDDGGAARVPRRKLRQLQHSRQSRRQLRADQRRVHGAEALQRCRLHDVASSAWITSPRLGM